jgi:hypothetical protein
MKLVVVAEQCNPIIADCLRPSTPTCRPAILMQKMPKSSPMEGTFDWCRSQTTIDGRNGHVVTSFFVCVAGEGLGCRLQLLEIHQYLLPRFHPVELKQK